MSTQPAQHCPPTRPESRRHRGLVAAATVVIVGGMLTLAACDVTDADGDASSDTGTTQTGTRDNPVPAGAPTQVGDWTVAMAPATTDATEVVLAENQFNSPPAEGRQFLMTEMSVTYDGTDSQTPWASLSVKFVGTDGNTYGTGSDDYCGVIPANLSDLGEMYAGASGAGNVCVSVPSTAVDGGAWSVEESFSFSGNPVFFALS